MHYPDEASRANYSCETVTFGLPQESSLCHEVRQHKCSRIDGSSYNKMIYVKSTANNYKLNHTKNYTQYIPWGRDPMLALGQTGVGWLSARQLTEDLLIFRMPQPYKLKVRPASYGQHLSIPVIGQNLVRLLPLWS